MISPASRFAILSAAILLALASCKKDDVKIVNPPEPPKKDSVVTPIDTNKFHTTLLLGVWTSHEHGWDHNRKGIWDKQERYAVDSFDRLVYMFNSDSTGTVTAPIGSVTFPLRWHIRDEGRLLWTETNFGGGVQDVATFDVISITDSLCILRDTTDTSHRYFSLKR